ncbi:hypothetical protein glysoja_042245 [Glycine soja]|uniref:Uncharacterized protein n=1 Tax=Glycine soja TaxID=3848 RepID=A0A0B2SA63_GLYSO|nr:hypothetical protein glysoja_042245 [Glycine soja]
MVIIIKPRAGYWSTTDSMFWLHSSSSNPSFSHLHHEFNVCHTVILYLIFYLRCNQLDNILTVGLVIYLLSYLRTVDQLELKS